MFEVKPLWNTPNAPGRWQTTRGLNRNRAQIVYGVKRLTGATAWTQQNIHSLATTAVGLTLGQTNHPDQTNFPNLVLVEQTVIPRNPDRCLVVCTWQSNLGFGRAFSPTSRFISSRVQRVMPLIRKINDTSAGAEPIYFIEREDVFERSQVIRVMRFPYGAGLSGNRQAILWKNVGNYYLLDGIPYVFDGWDGDQLNTGQFILTLYFRSFAPVRQQSIPGYIKLPSLGFLDEWILNYTNPQDGQAPVLLGVSVRRFNDLYQKGENLPGLDP